MVKVLILIICIFLALCLLLYLFQEKMIFFPQAEIVSTPQEIGLDFEEVWLKGKDGVRLNAWYVPAPQNGRNLTALFFHGNAGNISHRLEMLEIIHALGLSCLILDYRGYGQSQGRPSEQGMYNDARTAWEWLVQKRGIPGHRVISWGRSLGGPVSAWLAVQENPGALIIESTFTSLPEQGQKMYPFLPVKLISRYKFPTARYMQSVYCPVLVVHSPEDEFVPYRFARRLYEAAPEPKSFLQISGDHNQGFLISGKSYIQGLQSFLRTLDK